MSLIQLVVMTLVCDACGAVSEPMMVFPGGTPHPSSWQPGPGWRRLDELGLHYCPSCRPESDVAEGEG